MEYHFRYVESGLFLAQDVPLDEEGHEIAALQKLHDQVQIHIVLERVLQADYPRIAMHQHITLGTDMRHLVLL